MLSRRWSSSLGQFPNKAWGAPTAQDVPQIFPSHSWTQWDFIRGPDFLQLLSRQKLPPRTSFWACLGTCFPSRLDTAHYSSQWAQYVNCPHAYQTAAPLWKVLPQCSQVTTHRWPHPSCSTQVLPTEICTGVCWWWNYVSPCDMWHSRSQWFWSYRLLVGSICRFCNVGFWLAPDSQAEHSMASDRYVYILHCAKTPPSVASAWRRTAHI